MTSAWSSLSRKATAQRRPVPTALAEVPFLWPLGGVGWLWLNQPSPRRGFGMVLGLSPLQAAVRIRLSAQCGDAGPAPHRLAGDQCLLSPWLSSSLVRLPIPATAALAGRGGGLCQTARALSGHRPPDPGGLRGEGLPARVGVGEAGVGACTADSSPRPSSGLPPTWELRAWSPDELRGWERRAGWAGRGWALLSCCLTPPFPPPPAPPTQPVDGVLGGGMQASGAGAAAAEPASRRGLIPRQGCASLFCAISHVPSTSSAHLTRGHPDRICLEDGILPTLCNILDILG